MIGAEEARLAGVWKVAELRRPFGKGVYSEQNAGVVLRLFRSLRCHVLHYSRHPAALHWGYILGAP